MLINPWVVATTQDSRNLHPFFLKEKINKITMFFEQPKPL